MGEKYFQVVESCEESEREKPRTLMRKDPRLLMVSLRPLKSLTPCVLSRGSCCQQKLLAHIALQSR